MHQQQSLQVSELSKGIVTRHDSLHAFLSTYSNTNVGSCGTEGGDTVNDKPILRQNIEMITSVFTAEQKTFMGRSIWNLLLRGTPHPSFWTQKSEVTVAEHSKRLGLHKYLWKDLRWVGNSVWILHPAHKPSFPPTGWAPGTRVYQYGSLLWPQLSAMGRYVNFISPYSN